MANTKSKKDKKKSDIGEELVLHDLQLKEGAGVNQKFSYWQQLRQRNRTTVEDGWVKLLWQAPSRN